MQPIRWGIMATGEIAHSFAPDLALIPDAQLVAVGSRSMQTARAFADQYGARNAHGSYTELANDPDVDVVYIATPHGLHHDHILMCFDAGKHVLCEKALTLNARTTAHAIGEARRRGLFLMEAMWMRCNPNIRAMQELVATGELGDIQAVGADFGFLAANADKARLVDPALGASAILDIGIYPLTFAWLFLGQPERIISVGAVSERGVDLACASVLSYDDGAHATLSCTNTAVTPGHAFVAGSLGRIEVPRPFHRPDEFVVRTSDGDTVHRHPVTGRGYTHEIEEVHRCLRAGLTESAVIPLDDSLALMRLMDWMRSDLGCTLPGDEDCRPA